MKKLLLIIPNFGIGGAEKLVIDLALKIDVKKFNITILSYYKNNNTIYDKIIEKNNIKIIYLDKKVGFDLSMFKKVKKVVKELKPDIISTHLNCVLYLLPSTRKVKYKFHTVHNMADKEVSANNRKLMKIAYKFFGFKPVAISSTVRKSISEFYKLSLDKIPCIYNGINTANFSSGLEKNQKNIVLIATGRLSEQKNYIFMLDCFSEIAKTNDNVTLNILGDGIMRSEIEEKITVLNLTEKVKLCGVVPNVAEYLANSDIYLMSSFYEGLPLSVLEAMASSLPIVTTKAGGVVDIVKQNENGFISEQNDSSSYIKNIQKLIDDKVLRIKFGENSKEKSENYDIKICAKNYEKLFNGESF